MKQLIYFIFIFTCLSCGNEQKKEISIKKNSIAKTLIDSVKSKQSKAVLKVKLLNEGIGDKYITSKVKILEVIENKTIFKFKKTIKVLYYSWKPGIPKNKECIIYLTPYPHGNDTLNQRKEWMLLEGNGSYACECSK